MAALCYDFGAIVTVQVHIDASAAKGIVERKGLQKTRHIEVDVLWLQEMQARRLLPLSKIWGEINPADLMTKSVPLEKVLLFCKILHLKYQAGRANAAAKLHILGKGENTGKNEDQWSSHGDMRIWARSHNEWRRELFTPFGTRGSPPNYLRLKALRVTTGVTESGKHFQITDSWKDPQVCHRQLDFRWKGTTVFEEKHSGGQQCFNLGALDKNINIEGVQNGEGNGFKDVQKGGSKVRLLGSLCAAAPPQPLKSDKSEEYKYESEYHTGCIPTMIGAAFGQETRKEGFQNIIHFQHDYFANNKTGDVVKGEDFEKTRFELKQNADYRQVMEVQGKKNAQGAEVIPRAEARENHCAKGRGDQRKAEARRNEVHRDHPGHGDREAKPRYFEGNTCLAQCPWPEGGPDRTEAVRVRRAEDHPSSCDARCG